MRACAHCCPIECIVRKLPAAAVKLGELQQDFDVYNTIPVQQRATKSVLAKVGLASVWGYKVAQIIKVMGLGKRSIIQSIVLGI